MSEALQGPERSPGRPHSRWNRLGWRAFYCFVALAFSILLLELLVRILYAAGILHLPGPVCVIEYRDGAMQFDPIRGYRLSSTPARFAQVTNGVIEFQSVIRGNNQGFADRDDFAARRGTPNRFRIAVLGDSFTAAPYLRENWPDKVEDLAREAGQSVELLNCAIHGGGLANWWRMVTQLFEPEGYELDAVVIAVLAHDLTRHFFISEHRGYDKWMCGFVSDPPSEPWPLTLEEARPYLKEVDGILASPDRFDAYLRGDVHPNQPQGFWEPYCMLWIRPAAELAVEYLGYLYSVITTGKMPAFLPEDFQNWQTTMTAEIASYAKRHGLPVLVVRVPLKDDLLKDSPPDPLINLFATGLGATVEDGAKAFDGLDEEAIDAAWLPYDVHWGQPGSDRFAAFMFDTLRTWTRDFGGAASNR